MFFSSVCVRPALCEVRNRVTEGQLIGGVREMELTGVTARFQIRFNFSQLRFLEASEALMYSGVHCM